MQTRGGMTGVLKTELFDLEAATERIEVDIFDAGVAGALPDEPVGDGELDDHRNQQQDKQSAGSGDDRSFQPANAPVKLQALC